MPRLFDKVDDCITLGIGSVGTLTALSIAAIVRLNDEGAAIKGIVWAGTATNPRFGMGINGGELLILNVNGTGRASTTKVLITDGWCFVAVTKAAGTSTGRAHIYKYAADTWVHEALASTSPDPGGTPSTGILLGAFNNVSTPALFYGGDIAAAAIYSEAISDAEVESLAYGLMPWLRPSLVAGWLLDQAATTTNVVDLTGGGANQTALTGTTVTADAVPVFSYGHPVTLVERIYAAAPVVRTVAEAISTADVTARVGTFLRAPSEALSTADTVARAGTFLRATAEAVSTSDAAVRILSAVRTAAEAIATSDVATRAGTFVRAVSEAVTAADVVTRTGAFIRATSEAISTSDAAVALRSIIRTVAEAISTSDAATRSGTFTRAAAEAIATADVAARVVSAVRSAAEAVSTSDVATRIGTFIRTTAEAIATSDVVEAIKTGGTLVIRTVAEALSTSDVATRTGTFIRTTAEAVSTSDVATQARTLIRSAVESLSTSDVAARLLTLFRTAVETLGAADVARVPIPSGYPGSGSASASQAISGSAVSTPLVGTAQTTQLSGEATTTQLSGTARGDP